MTDYYQFCAYDGIIRTYINKLSERHVALGNPIVYFNEDIMNSSNTRLPLFEGLVFTGFNEDDIFQYYVNLAVLPFGNHNLPFNDFVNFPEFGTPETGRSSEFSWSNIQREVWAMAKNFVNRERLDFTTFKYPDNVKWPHGFPNQDEAEISTQYPLPEIPYHRFAAFEDIHPRSAFVRPTFLRIFERTITSLEDFMEDTPFPVKENDLARLVAKPPTPKPVYQGSIFKAIMVDDVLKWELTDADDPDYLRAYGLPQAGDIMGEHIIKDLDLAFSLLRTTLHIQFNVVGQLHGTFYNSEPVVVEDIITNYDLPFSPGSSLCGGALTTIGIYNLMIYNPTNGSYVQCDSSGFLKFNASWPGLTGTGTYHYGALALSFSPAGNPIPINSYTQLNQTSGNMAELVSNPISGSRIPLSNIEPFAKEWSAYPILFIDWDFTP